MFYRLPPVGGRIAPIWAGGDHPRLDDAFPGYAVRWYGSGTMALAAAIMAAKELRRTERPEVVLPAYGCPDLVSAARYAGVRPVLVDLEPRRPWMDKDQLKGRIGANTVAVLAVHFLGIPERVREISRILADSGVVLIEDSAQYLPSCREAGAWEGDFIVLSFGRGKPLSLLGGGAVLSRSNSMEQLLPEASREKPLVSTWAEDATVRGKTAVYNALLSPRLFWLTAFVPGLHLGETRYRPLTGLSGARSGVPERVKMNLVNLRHEPWRAASWISDMLGKFRSAEICDLPRECGVRNVEELLRYPVLTRAPELRDQIFHILDRAGLGVSRMYPAPLPEIDGLRGMLAGPTRFSRALEFSQRILTLPTHAEVKQVDVSAMRRLLEQAVA